jgi:Transposase IS200 like
VCADIETELVESTGNKLWSSSYFAGSVGGAALSMVKPYIEQQNRQVQGTARALTALPARTFAPGLKAGALARIRVAREPGSEKS